VYNFPGVKERIFPNMNVDLIKVRNLI